MVKYKNVNREGQSIGEHRLVAERVLGRKISRPIVVHHVDGDKSNNKNTNLVICPDQSYHRIIHRRQRALYQGGNANFRLCRRCGKWDDQNNDMWCGKDTAFHRACEAKAARAERAAGLRL